MKQTSKVGLAAGKALLGVVGPDFGYGWGHLVIISIP